MMSPQGEAFSAGIGRPPPPGPDPGHGNFPYTPPPYIEVAAAILPHHRGELAAIIRINRTNPILQLHMVGMLCICQCQALQLRMGMVGLPGTRRWSTTGTIGNSNNTAMEGSFGYWGSSFGVGSSVGVGNWCWGAWGSSVGIGN